MIKAQMSGRMVSSRMSEVVTASVYSEKTCLKKLVMIMKIVINEKGDVGMAKQFSKKYGNKG